MAVMALASGVVGAAPGQPHGNPPNPDKIAQMLVRTGRIPPNATAGQRESALTAYLQTKLKGALKTESNAAIRKNVQAAESALNTAASLVSGRKLGLSASVAPSSPQFKALQSTGKLVVILVEFSDTPFTWMAGTTQRTEAGPLHNKLPAPTGNFDLWVPDFNVAHYQAMMFQPGGWTFPAGVPFYAGQRRSSMRDLYLEMSYGRYTVTGDTYGWFKVDKPEAYYGDDSPAGGTDSQLPGTPRTLIADAVQVINSQNAIKWDAYDTDHNCVVDHPLFVHAGDDQSGGGGAQGDDAIWAHRSSAANVNVGATAGCPAGMRIQNYTIMNENGGIGVFAHEFGHDLGLPDEYDTAYSGRGESIQFWSLMAGGSWLGKPAQSQPPFMSPWARQVLGWLAVGEQSRGHEPRRDSSQRGRGAAGACGALGRTNSLNALRVNLPPLRVVTNVPHSGSLEWYGGNADLLDSRLARAVNLAGKTTASLSFWTWYDTEPLWDFFFVQVSTDNGVTWTSLPIAGTTTNHDPGAMPEIVANLPGFTGNSGGWVNKTANLSAYSGQQILIQFRYMTDWASTMAGVYVDDIAIVADGTTIFSDNAETLAPGWVNAGWTRVTGADLFPHYYMLEWRNTSQFSSPYSNYSIPNADIGLNNIYQFDPFGLSGPSPLYFPYSPGLVLWYRNTRYTDNWVGFHPGGGFLLVVDAHKQAINTPPLPGSGVFVWGSAVQSMDGAFSLNRTPDFPVLWAGSLYTTPGLNAVPNFDDNQTYWSSRIPWASALTPTYGFSFRVLGNAQDGSAVLVGLGQK